MSKTQSACAGQLRKGCWSTDAGISKRLVLGKCKVTAAEVKSIMGDADSTRKQTERSKALLHPAFESPPLLCAPTDQAEVWFAESQPQYHRAEYRRVVVKQKKLLNIQHNGLT